MKVLVSDTSVLIDLDRAGLLEATFRLEFQFEVPDVLYRKEIDPYPELRRLVTWGLGISEVSPTGVGRAQLYRADRPGLSAVDALALALAFERGWVLLTGDGDLRSLAEDEGVERHGVLWIFDCLEESRILKAKELHQALSTLAAHPRCRLPKQEITSRLERWDSS